MKKTTLILLSILLIFTIAACKSRDEHSYDNDCDTTCDTVLTSSKTQNVAQSDDDSTPLTDTDHNTVRDTTDAHISLDGAPKDENEGIDLPLVPNN